MDKLKMHSPDLKDENIAKIRTLFPNCVSEATDENGNLRLAIDFEQLRQELSDSIVEGPQERYRLDWPGKREALVTANTPIAKTLRPCREESVDFDTTQNLFIEGDNLDALKLLQETYLGKVKMIYIDPPYNIDKGFIYRDNFAADKQDYLEDSGQVDEAGGKLISNPESNGRYHSDWLSMMYPRLKLARNLLRDDGVIFINIDDGEIANLRKICDEIFDSKNFLGDIVWKKKTNGNNVGHIPPVHDFFVCYAKDETTEPLIGFAASQEFIERTYSNPDNDPRGAWTTSDLSANHKGPHFPILNESTGKIYEPAKGRYWVFNEKEVLKRIDDGRIIFGKSGKAAPVQKKYLSNRGAIRFKPESWWDNHGYNSDGTAELGELFEPKIFDHPKPTKTLKKICEISTFDEDIIFDFFAGTASCPDAVMQLNSSDGGSRSFIAVQLPEHIIGGSIAFKAGYFTIAEISKERIRRAGKKILEGECHKDWNKEVGFRVLKIDTSNMVDLHYTPEATVQGELLSAVDNIKPGRDNPEDLLFQVLVDWGVDLTLPIRRETIQGKRVFFVNHAPYDLIACFDQSITEELVKELATHKPVRVVFRDNGFVSDAVKINVDQIFRQLSPATEVKAI